MTERWLSRTRPDATRSGGNHILLGYRSCSGGMAEWTKAAVLKTAEPLAGSVGSNPTPSALNPLLRMAFRPVSREVDDLATTSRGALGAR